MINWFKKKQPLTQVDSEDLIGKYSGLYCPKCNHELFVNKRNYWCSDGDFCNYKIKKEDVIINKTHTFENENWTLCKSPIFPKTI